MKKKLLSVNFLLYLIIFTFVAVYFGYRFGNTSLSIGEKLEYLVLFVPYLMLLLVSVWFVRKPQPAKYYSAAAIATLIVGSLPMVYLIRIPIIMIQLQGYEYSIVGDLTGNIVRSSVVFVLSGLIATGYFKCAAITRKEQAEPAELPKTE